MIENQMSNLDPIAESDEKDNIQDAASSSTLLEPPLLSSAPNRFTPYPSAAIGEFLTDDDGQSLLNDEDEEIIAGLQNQKPPTNSSTLSLALSRVSTRLSRRSSLSIDSATPHFINNGGKILPLATFCTLIDRSASLERATILSVECFRERTNLGVLHRTLIFHLHRQGRSDVWLRIDRRRAEGVSIPALALRGGKTEANDVAQLASSKAHLLRRPRARPENRVEFASPPTLGAFRFFLQVICEELLEYHVWPANCWFLCSLLEEHLYESGGGSFAIGDHLYLDLAPSLRSQVSTRIYHEVPHPPSVTALVSHLINISHYAHARRVHLQTLAQLHDLGTPHQWSELQYLHLLILELRAIRHEVSRLLQDDDIRTTVAQLDVQILFLHRRMYERYPSSIPLQLVVVELRSKLYRTDLGSDRIAEFHKLRAQFEDEPIKYWLGFVTQLIQLANIAAALDPELAQLCTMEARRIRDRFPSDVPWVNVQTFEAPERVRWSPSMLFSPGGDLILAYSHFEMVIWNAMTGEILAQCNQNSGWGGILAATFVQDGSRIACFTTKAEVEWMETRNLLSHGSGAFVSERTKLLDFERSWHVCNQAVFGLDAEWAVAVHLTHWGTAKSVTSWNVSTGAKVSLLEPTNDVADISGTARDQNLVAVLVSPRDKDWTIFVWDMSTGCVMHRIDVGERSLQDYALSPNGRVLVVCHRNGALDRWDVGSDQQLGKPVWAQTLPDSPISRKTLAFSPDGAEIFTGGDHSISVWDARTGESIGSSVVLPTEFKEVKCIAFPLNGRKMVTIGGPGVRVWIPLVDL